jgi:hypothetical protein
VAQVVKRPKSTDEKRSIGLLAPGRLWYNSPTPEPDIVHDPAEFPDPHQGEVDLSLIDANLRLTPKQRLERRD